MRILEHTVTPDEEGRPLKSLVPGTFHLSTHAFRRLKVSGGIKVNGIAQHVTATVHAGDTITIHLASESISTASTAESPLSSQEEIPMPDRQLFGGLILYLDEDIIIANKPAPLATLPGRYTGGDTLRERIADALGLNPDAPYHPVNRLDKGTSGLLCIARHDHAQFLLTKALHTGTFSREYLAVTEGCPSSPSGIIDLPIAREDSGARRMVHPDGKPSITRYTVLYSEQEGGRALLRLNLETGRTHQIRVHLSAAGSPIVGDYLYGQAHPDLRDRFALHSARLTCTQPVTGKTIDIIAPFPDTLAALFQHPDMARACIRFDSP